MSTKPDMEETKRMAVQFARWIIPESPLSLVENTAFTASMVLLGASVGMYYQGGTLIADLCDPGLFGYSPTCNAAVRKVNQHTVLAGVAFVPLYLLSLYLDARGEA